MQLSQFLLLCIQTYFYQNRYFFQIDLPIFKLPYMFSTSDEHEILSYSHTKTVTEAKFLKGKFKHRIIGKHTVQVKLQWKTLLGL